MSLTASDIIASARSVTGNKENNAAGELSIPDADILIAIKPAIRAVNLRYGSASTGKKETTFSTVANQQDYAFTDIADDIQTIETVVRSGAFVDDHLTESMSFNPSDGLPRRMTGDIIPVGNHEIAIGTIIAQRRAYWADQFVWKVVNGTTLRLMPCPTSIETVAVEYTTNGQSIDGLPELAEVALTYAACAAIFDCMINRKMSDPVTGAEFRTDSDERLKLLVKQRDYYTERYTSEIENLPG